MLLSPVMRKPALPTAPVAVTPALRHLSSTPLPLPDRVGSPALLGIDAAGRVAVELLYGADSADCWLAQYVFSADGTPLDQRDEAYGHNPHFAPFDLADFSLDRPETAEAVQPLIFAGGRWRGLRETDRVPDVLHPLTVAEKIELTALGLPDNLLGVVESQVLAMVAINMDWLLLCRRVRLAYVTPYSRDADGTPFDYDSCAVHFVQWLPRQADDAGSQPLPQLMRDSRAMFGAQPTDLLYNPQWQRLYLIDNGTPTEPALLHIFAI